MSLPILQYLNFFITYRCNFKCKHCFINSQNVRCEHLTIKEIKKIIKFLKSALKVVIITGGEPFLREDLIDVCLYFSKDNHVRHININTNGWETDKILKFCDEFIKKRYPNTNLSVQISIDGPRQIHDYLRERGSFDRSMHTIKYLKSLKNIKIFTMTTINNINKDHINEIDQIAKKLNIINKFQYMRDNRNDVFNLDKNNQSNLSPSLQILSLNLEDIINISNKINKFEQADIQRKMRQLMIKNLISTKKDFKCVAGNSYGVLFPDGQVSFCEPVKPFVNIKKYNMNLEKAWNSQEANAMRTRIKNCICMDSCAHLFSVLK